MKKIHSKSEAVNWLVFGMFFLFFITIAIIIYFLLNGKTTTTGNIPDSTISKNLHCTARNKEYPFFQYNNSQNETTDIIAIFGNDELKSIALVQTMYYDDKQGAIDSYNINHASMNKSFGQEFGPDAFSAKYNTTDATMEMRLYATGNLLTQSAKKFFLITTSSMTLEDIKTDLTNQSFECTENN